MLRALRADRAGAAVRIGKPWLLDLFCGAGGATKGYQRAGFYVVGVDNRAQPNYCGDEFIQADALDPSVLWDDFDAVHASPPCQAFTRYRNRPNHVREAPDLIGPTRELLRVTSLPYVIENVEGAPLENASMLCGSSFGLPLRRHRFFETNWPLLTPPCAHGWQQGLRLYPQATNRKNKRNTVEVGTWRIPVDIQEQAMEIDWMDFRVRREDRKPGCGANHFGSEFSQAVPPVYTELIGHQLATYIRNAMQVPQ